MKRLRIPYQFWVLANRSQHNVTHEPIEWTIERRWRQIDWTMYPIPY